MRQGSGYKELEGELELLPHLLLSLGGVCDTGETGLVTHEQRKQLQDY